MSGLKLVSYNNRPYSILVKPKGDKFVASISVNGAIAEGNTEDESIENLRIILGKLEQSTNKGKDKLLLG